MNTIDSDPGACRFECKDSRPLNLKFPTTREEGTHDPPLYLARMRTNKQISDLLVQQRIATIDQIGFASLNVDMEKIDTLDWGKKIFHRHHRQLIVATYADSPQALFFCRTKDRLEPPLRPGILLAGKESDTPLSGSNAVMKCELLWSKSVARARLTGEVEMAEIALNADQADIQPFAVRGNARVVEPAPPTATKLDNGEAAACQIHGAQGSTPFSNICMPISGYGDRFNLACATFKEPRKESGIDQHTEKVGQIARVSDKVRYGVVAYHGDRIESGIVEEERAAF